MNKIQSIMITLLILNCIGLSNAVETSSFSDDFDPLVDLQIILNILEIRCLEESIKDNEPDVFMKIYINNDEFISPNWQNQKYIKNPDFSITSNIPDDQEFVLIQLELWDTSTDEERLCDIGNINKTVKITYDVKSGRWDGEDSHKDPSGYGRLCGCDDGSIYENELDYEIWFSIHQNDYDADGIPYWYEVNQYHTNPEKSNIGEDIDNDGIPIEWEHIWIYDPYVADNHQLLDEDKDSISNIEEYLTTQFNSDPFRKDIFLEIDWMDEGPNGEISQVPEKARELLQNPFHRRNYVFHVDMGEQNGGEIIPFKELTEQGEVRTLYETYFMHNNTFSWRRGIFHYAVFVNLCFPRGYAFSGDTEPYWGYHPGTNSFIVSSRLMEDKNNALKFKDKSLEYFYGSVIMHEMGHNFGIRNGHPGGCDNFFAKYPWQIQFWIYRTYVSIMNYQYTYYHFDYSDGTHGWNDFDDWSNLNLSYFEIPDAQ